MMYTSNYQKYVRTIMKTKHMSQEELQICFAEYKKTHAKAIKDKIIMSNMKFVVAVVNKYKDSKVDLGDLINEGVIGLNYAIEKYDYTRGNKFITYAVFWIKAYVRQAIDRYKNAIRLPANRVIQCNKAVLANANGTQIDAETMKYLMLNNGNVSLDAKLDSDNKHTIGEIISDHKDDIMIEDNINTIITQLTACLPENEKKVLYESCGYNTDKPHSLREIGEGMHFSHCRIKQLRDQALRRIKKYNTPEFLEAAKDSIIN